MVLRTILIVMLWATLSGCGNYGGDANDDSSEEPADGGFAASSSPDRADLIAGFETNTFVVLRDHCESCHSGAGPGFPNIAHVDLDLAYNAVMDTQKVNLLAPESSRLVQRLATDLHFCWSDCAADASEMQESIEAWAAEVDFSGGGTDVEEGVGSEISRFSEGIEDTSNERYLDHVIAFWDFKEGSGSVAYDKSGVEPAMDLALSGFEWMSNYGIEIVEGSARASLPSSRKLYDHIAAPNGGTQEYSVEAWVIPANTSQDGPARIVTYSSNASNRNFTLGQTLYTYDYRNRSIDEAVSDNGTPSLVTADGDADLQATLQHVVVTYDQYRGRRIYVNGVFTDDVDPLEPARLWDWNAGYRFVLGNEATNNRLWLGRIQLVAVYEHALSQAQITQNFNAGVGKKVLLRFDLSQWLDDGSYIEFEVSELDDYSYQFCEPTLVSTSPAGLRVRNIRVSVNGTVPVSGQAFRTLDVPFTGGEQMLSRQCTVIPKGMGVDLDDFAIEFEILGDFQNLIVDVPFPPPPPSPDVADPLPLEGLRDFERTNATMALVTGIDPTTPAVADTFEQIREQLPAAFDLRTFTSSNQVGVAKLALEYCDQMVESPAARDAFFGNTPPFPFDAPTPTAFATPADRDRIIVPITDRMLGIAVANQPDSSAVQAELDALIDELTLGCDAVTCGGERTRTVVKALCAAVLSSAGVLVH
jgi:hypothetical protein